MKLLAIGDVHHHIKAAEEIASKYEDTHKIIFTGDYFDDYGDNAEVARKTAIWLKYSITKPNRFHLLGNHDLSYNTFCEWVANGRVCKMYPCSGFKESKDAMITELMGRKEWSHFRFHHFENGWHFCHAGISAFWFEKPEGVTNENILVTIEELQNDFFESKPNHIIGAAGRSRYGPYEIGGIVWQDHYGEAQPIRGIKQVYGHTRCHVRGHTPRYTGIDVFKDCGGININIDCGLSQVLEIEEDGTYNIIDTGYDNFYDGPKNKNNLWNS